MACRDSQISLPPMEVAKETPQDAARVNHTPDPAMRPNHTQAMETAAVLAAQFFNDAIEDARITTAEVAYLLNVSESLVRRMRSRDARECVSFVQLLRLPPAFHLSLHRRLNAHYGFGRQALLDLLDAVGRLAVTK